MQKLTLVCFNCGNKKDVIVDKRPQFAFELIKIANDVGFKAVIDNNHKRTLIFCNDQCADKQKTKKGLYRVRPKKIK